MKFETIIYEKEGPLAWITLNRPEKLNSITRRMTAEILLATDKAQCDDDVRVIVLKGAGRAFSAGFDLEINEKPDLTEEDELQELKAELHADFDLIMPRVDLFVTTEYDTMALCEQHIQASLKARPLPGTQLIP